MSHRKAAVTEHYPVALQADKQMSERQNGRAKLGWVLQSDHS